MAAGCEMKSLLFLLALLQLLGEYARGPAAVAGRGDRRATSAFRVCCRQPRLGTGSVTQSVPGRQTGEGISSRTQGRQAGD